MEWVHAVPRKQMKRRITGRVARYSWVVKSWTGLEGLSLWLETEDLIGIGGGKCSCRPMLCGHTHACDQAVMRKRVV